ncbi:MAG: DUF711 family protein [Anaerolineales bacterium]
MKIRSITVFLPLKATQYRTDNQSGTRDILEQYLSFAAQLRRESQAIFQSQGIEVQSYRLATNPFGLMFETFQLEKCVDWAVTLEQQAGHAGFDYLSLGPALVQKPATIEAAVEILRKTSNVFVSAKITDGNAVDIPFALQTAQAIQQISRIEPNGFANLRFAALANVAAGAPFFPAAYHQGEQFGFSFAMEAADLIIDEVTGAEDFLDAQKRIKARWEKEALRIEDILREMMSALERIPTPAALQFLGIDFTPAPFPEISRSLGTALEKLGIDYVGDSGSLAGSAFLTSCLDSAQFPRIGFNGLMMPLLEDATLALRAAQEKLSVNDLLIYSAVCGTGLDTIPLAGDVTEDALTALLLDLAALALRLDKPLTARLMPIPGKKVGEETTFDFGFFANSRILPIKEGRLSGLFQHSERLIIQPRKQA